MAETTVDIDALDEENAPSSYTTETEESAPGRGQSITAPGSGLGRRKEAIARVRATGEAVKLDAMNPFERKVCHDVVAEEGLTSESEGAEPHRRVVILPEDTDGE